MNAPWKDIDYSGTPFAGLPQKLSLSSGNNYQGLPAAIINLLMPYLFVLAGIILFAIFLIAGFNMLTSFGDENKISSAKKMLTNAVIGFVILFISYWLLLLIKIILGI